jgi:signal transduction histidine kinase
MYLPLRIIAVWLLCTATAYSQYNPNLLKAEKLVDSFDTKAAILLLKNVDTLALSLPDKALYMYIKAKTIENNGDEDVAVKYYLLAKNKFKQADSLDRAININLDIVYLIDAQSNNSTDYLPYITEYLKHSAIKNDPAKIARGYSYMAMYKIRKRDFKASRDYYLQALNLIKQTNNKEQESSLYNNIASVYNEHLKKPDSGLYYLQKSLPLINDLGNNPYSLYYNYVNQASSFRHLKQYQKAIDFLKKADSLPIVENKLKHKELLYSVMHENYRSIEDYKNAYNYLLQTFKLADSINVTEQNIAIGDINTKYQTLEKELENRNLRENNKLNKILLYILIGLLAAGTVIGLLIVKNAKRKEKISLQDKLIEQQKFDKALKDYELSSIDLMLQGQEKERQRIANDLHDNLGSMLATLKLNFENLRMRQNDVAGDENKLYEKTDNLIDEAYQKVRRLAHAKNAGVFANDGLIPAIKKLAAKISIPGKLQINVIPFGFTDRLDNTLEIAIFRIVQELATNIIKHSKATEATIHLTQHDYNLNVIIEDNGVGMDTGKVNMADGMGLQSISKKAEQLDGTLTIDSTPGRGTTIILDLPI